MTPRPYSSDRRVAAAAETRRVVLAAALSLFQERGFAQTTIGDIARTAGVAVNTVYLSVGGKPSLLTALIEDGASDTAINEVLDAVVVAVDGEAVIDVLVTGTGAVAEDHEWLLGELYDNAGADEAIGAAVHAAERLYSERLASGAGRLEELGALRPDVDVATAADFLWFYLGYRSWLVLRSRGWSWPRAQSWLLAQCRTALLR